MIKILTDVAADDAKVKAIFDHFTQLLTAGAVVAVGRWLQLHPQHENALTLLYLFGGSLLTLAGIALFLLAAFNAQMRLMRAGYSGFWILLAWTPYIMFGLLAMMLHSLQ